MIREALFADLTEFYIKPHEPETGQTVRLFFRAGKNDDLRVCIHPLTALPQEDIEMVRSDRAGDDEIFAWYEVSIEMPGEPLWYYFTVSAGEEFCCYSRGGVVDNTESAAGQPFVLIPGFYTPGWAKGAVCYQIMVDRFRNGDLSNDVRGDEYTYLGKPCGAHKCWDDLPGNEDYRDFYGGDLQGVIDKLDYLKHLGVDVIYFNPLFESPSSHKYDTQDYEHIDPHFGSDELFAHLVEQMHQRGMRVILDGVFNHCGSFNHWLGVETEDEDGAYLNPDSPYRDYFLFTDESAWPRNDSYMKWWDNKTLPKLNYGSEKLRAKILEIAAKWVSPPYNADGWRLDVAADLGMSAEMNHSFWKEFRAAVRKANPDALIIAEHYEDPAPWLGGDEWDSLMNYQAFFDPVSLFFTGMEKHADRWEPDRYRNGYAFALSLLGAGSRLPGPSVEVALNQLSNHDHTRFLTRTNHTEGRLVNRGAAAANDRVSKPVLRAAALFQMAWTGMPGIYYGDEAGVAGWTDPDNRRTYPWGWEDMDLIHFHQLLTYFRHTHPAMMGGSVKILGAGEGWFVFGRFTDDEQVIAAFTVECHQIAKEGLLIPVWQTGAKKDAAFRRILMTDSDSFSLADVMHQQHDGMIRVDMPETGAVLLESTEYHFPPAI